MKRTIQSLLILCGWLAFCPASAQVVEKADVSVAFDLSQPGVRYSPTWGVDVAWPNEQNVRKAINHMGKENIGIGRSAFRFAKPLSEDSVLSNDAVNYLRQRANILKLVSNTLPVVLTADQEAGADPYFVVNKVCDVNHWAANINSHVHWMQKNTKLPVVGVSPYNEPDYWTVEEGASVARQVQVAKLLREQYPRMDTIAIVGGNTLNDDKALEWYTSGKQYYDWGNTHQLAGSFANFANFFQQLKKDGKIGYADEMHNVAEAMVGLEYGMTVGVWWGFDSRARGEFCDISRNGERLAYGEHRNNWTAASVYRHDDGRVKAFIGTSERQAATTTYQFVSADRPVYFDGQGPLHQFRMEIPGGTGYQKGQTNAERVIDIEWGDDVPPTPITAGIYKLVNKATGNVLTVANGNIVMQKWTGAKTQQWNLTPNNPRIGGDYSYYDLLSVSDGKTRPNLLDFSTYDNANIIAYNRNATPTTNEQWNLQYAGDGCYYLRCRESALYMAAASSGTNNGVNVVQKKLSTDEGMRNRLLWRLLPIDVDYDTEAPAQPQGLSVTPQPTSMVLDWQKGTEADLDGYMVLRAEQEQGEWNTIARHAEPPFVDNATLVGHTYIYKVKAIDRSQNQSQPSAEVTASTLQEHALVAYWPLDGSLDDASPNGRHAAAALDATYEEGHQADSKAQSLRMVKGQYLQLPVGVVQGDELSVGLWLQPASTTAKMRVFDFGYDTNHYVYLTTNNGSSKMRLAINNGESEQVLDCPRLQAFKWRHVVVTMKPGHAAIYLDGELAAETDAFTISPASVHPVVCYLGRSQFNADPYFQGNMEQVCIFNYALSADEVAKVYGEALGVAPALADQQPAAIYAPNGMRLQQPRHGLNIIGGKKIVVDKP